MEDWIEALKNASKKDSHQSNKELLSGHHSWYDCSHAKPTFCNVCREAFIGVRSRCQSCEVCKFKVHKRCMSRAPRNCKWTTLASIGSKKIIEDQDRNYFMPHQWLEGNLPVNVKCSYCDKVCGSVRRMQDYRCLWCKAYVHKVCKNSFQKRCDLGVCRVSILPPTYVNTVSSDGFIRASRAPNTSPLVVFVNSKSGDNQGVKFLRKFKQLLNPFQVFDLIQGGPTLGLRLFQNLDCFRVLVCGGDGSVGWVLKEIDNLDLHKKCQIGVLPLGTGNDLARVLGWGAVLDDDNQLPKLLESFERATTKMLDRWSILTYENPLMISANNHQLSQPHAYTPIKNSNSNLRLSVSERPSTHNLSKSNSNIPANLKLTLDFPPRAESQNQGFYDDLSTLRSDILQSLADLLQNKNIGKVIESSRTLNEKVFELTLRITEMYNHKKLTSYNSLGLGSMHIGKNKSNLNLTKYQEECTENIDVKAELAAQRCSAVKEKLNCFFELLKDELKSAHTPQQRNHINGSHATNNVLSASASSESDNTDDSFFDTNPNKNAEDDEEDDDIDDDIDSYDELEEQATGQQALTLNDHTLLNVINDQKFYSSSLEISSSPKRPSSSTSQIHVMNGLIVHQVLASIGPNKPPRLTPNNNNCNNDAEMFLGGPPSLVNTASRRQMLTTISKMFRDRRKVLTRANSFKKAINQVFKLADKPKTNLASSSINLSINHSPSNLMQLRPLDHDRISQTDKLNASLHGDNLMTSNQYSHSHVPKIVYQVKGDDAADDADIDEFNMQKESSEYAQDEPHETSGGFNYDLDDDEYDANYSQHNTAGDYYSRGERPHTLNLDRSKTSPGLPAPINCQQDPLSDFVINDCKSNENDTVDQMSLCYTNEENDYRICSKELSLQCFSLKDDGRFCGTIDDFANYIDTKPILSNQDDLISMKSHVHEKMNKGPQFEKRINELINQKLCNCDRPLPSSMTCCSINESQILAKSPSSLTINKSLFNGVYNCNGAPLASEEQSCMSTPITAKLSPSNEEPGFRQSQSSGTRNGTVNTFNTNTTSSMNSNATNSNTVSTGTIVSTASRPNELSMGNMNQISIKIVKSSPNLHENDESNAEIPPQIRVTQNDSDENELDRKSLYGHSPSPSYLGYLPSASSTAITPTHTFMDTSSNSEMNLSNSAKANGPTKVKPKPFLLPPPLISLPSSSPNLNSSSSSNNLSARTSDFNCLGIPASPSGYSSSGSGFSKTPLPSPRISKKYSKMDMKSSYWQLAHQRGISALSSTMRHRSRSKSSDKSSSPTSPSSPKFSFKQFPTNTSYGFIEKALLFNANALCAPIAAPVIDEPDLNLFTEKAVMNNYFGIGLDAKLALEFHITREEHPEKCRSRIRNHMLYGFLGGKEFVQRTYKNLEQKVLLECDGIQIPLKNVQGIVVLNIPSYTGGVNFWGTHNSKDDNPFVVPSFDDKILEVVAVSGCMQMALSRVVNISSNRIAQCRCVKIQILGSEGVPVQVDGEAWIQPPGIIYLVHKNRAQMLTRNKMFEHTLKTWSEKQKNDSNFLVSLSKEELDALQTVVDKATSLIKRIKTASLRNSPIEHDLSGYATQASSNLEAITLNGKLSEKSLRQQITDFLNSIGTLQSETGMFINEKAQNLRIEPEIMEKIQEALREIRIALRNLNDYQGIFQFPIENDQEFKPNKSRFSLVKRYKNLRIKHRDDKDMLKTLHSVPLEEWGPDEVALWLESLNLSEYRSAFIKHDIRGTELRNLRHRDLRDIGIVKVGHIKRILDASKSIPKRVALEKQSV